LTILLALYSFGGLLLAGLSVPLILQKIPPNGIYGFRLPSTPKDPQLWYTINAFAGKRLLMVGLGTAFAAIILFYTTHQNVNHYALNCLGVFLALSLWAIISSILYLRDIQK
jgi:uncharacterized membrane protein